MVSTTRVREKIVFSRNLSAMLAAGLSLSRSVGIIEKQTADEKFRRVVASLSHSIRKGKNLSEALLEHPEVFSSFVVSKVLSGEESDSLAKALNDIASHLEQSYNSAKKVRRAIIYPAVILAVIIIAGIFLLSTPFTTTYNYN